ncbi:MAG: hypothetical protein RLZZ179_772 [Verrucomicrobiota bacterium]|jgi:hypothetical protein
MSGWFEGHGMARMVMSDKKICGPPGDVIPERPAVNRPATRPSDSFLVTNKFLITASNL